MKKIPTVFVRNQETKLVTLEVTKGCEWVIEGEGIATRKYDGTCCLVKDGVLYKRHEVKKDRGYPGGFVLADHDEITGKRYGWVPVMLGPEDRYHRDAFQRLCYQTGTEFTCELVGPKVQGNPEGFSEHVLLPHKSIAEWPGFPRTYSGMEQALELADVEGVVFHHPDGRMAKIKKRDFGHRR